MSEAVLHSGGAAVVHRELRVSGLVQGVGFRPFVYRLAHQYSLQGIVWNDSQGVGIRIQGRKQDVEAFSLGLIANQPSAARIEHTQVRDVPPKPYIGFAIVTSHSTSELTTQLSPDLAICDECRREFFDERNRRHGHVFINCTQCGPRFTIIRNLPYDRPATSMSGFEMCPICRIEYEDPANRRFHAQPVACRNCGPQAFFKSSNTPAGWSLSGDDALANAVHLLKNRGILLVEGVGGFHLACDARDDNVVQELRQRKQRDRKPLAVMFPDVETVARWCELSDCETRELTSARAPIVVLAQRADCPVANGVSADHPTIGALLPYAPLQLGLVSAFGAPLVMTSANLSGYPIIYDTQKALLLIPELADAVFYHDRPIEMFADDSVVRVIHGDTQILRRSRGYVPRPIDIPVNLSSSILAFGTDLKNVFAIGRDHSVTMSQHIGDMDNEATIFAAVRAIEHLTAIQRFQPEIIVHDLHPDYGSTRLAKEWCSRSGASHVGVQHHHAHLVSCMADNGVRERTIGVILDGTGLGDDGAIWGGELLFGDFAGYERIGHLEYTPLLGNDCAAQQPWRMALSWLWNIHGEDCLDSDTPLIKQLRTEFREIDLRLLLEMTSRCHFQNTSSCGRLFDAIAALIGFGTQSQYEGQAGLWLEGIVSNEHGRSYDLQIHNEGGALALSPEGLIEGVLSDISCGVSSSTIAYRVHDAIARAWTDMALRAVEMNSCDNIALSGGCFQNKLLLERMSTLLKERKLNVLIHRQVPANDGGIALGQVCVAGMEAA